MQTDDVQEIRNRLNIVDVIAEDVQLKKSGRTYKGLCPFHQEKTASFYVDPAKQLFYCFGCGEGGDIFTYISKRDHLDFSQALEYLAEKIGYQLSKNRGMVGSKKRLYEANELAAKFYHALLKKPLGQKALTYLKKRGLDQAVDLFMLGYAPDSQSCLKFLLKKGFKQQELVKAGFALNAQGNLYDRFKYRLIFPIQDFQGRFVGFGGRSLDNTLPKYINSPETVLFKKSHLLYGLPQAKNAILKLQTAIVVEGYTDLIALYLAHIDNVVATLGTAFTEEHLNFLSRYCQKVILIFDGDEAGQRATERCRQFLPHLATVDIKVLILPEQLDPADYVKKYGGERFKELTVEAKPLFEFLVNRLTVKYGLNTPEAKINLAKQTVKLLTSVSSPLSQEQYLKKAAELLGVSYEVLVLEFKRATRPNDSLKLTKELEITVDAATAATQVVEKEILKLMLKYPEKIKIVQDIPDKHWQNPEHLRLFTAFKQLSLKSTASDNSLLAMLNENDKKVYAKLNMELNRVSQNEQTVDNYLKVLKNKLKQRFLEKEIKVLKAKLENINKEDKNFDDVFKKLVSLERERHKIKMEAR